MKFDLPVEESGTGTPTLLLHSSGLSGRQWRRLVPGLVARGLRTIVPDLTGHGASEVWPEPKPFSFRTDVARVVTLLEAVGPAHLVGHSYGGLVALHAALAAPRSVRSIVAFDPVAFGALDPVADVDARAELTEVELPWGKRPEDHERWLEMFVDYWGGQGAWAGLQEPARAEFRRVGWVVYEGVRTLAQDATSAREYGAIGAPVHLLTGDNSRHAAQRVIKRLGDALPDVHTATVANAGHMAPLTHADLVNALILDALVSPPPT